MNRERAYKYLVACLLSLGLLFGTTACTKKNIASQSGQSVPGSEAFVQPVSTGTSFIVSESKGQKVILESSEPVRLHPLFDSSPKMVAMSLESIDGAGSAEMTIKGLKPETTYHRYEDDYHNHTPFTTDATGSYTYVQDLSMPRLVFIQTVAGTHFIRDDSTGGDCTAIGTWDGATKTCSLTSDVYETVQIDAGGITLDGGGYTLWGGGSGIGLYLYRKTGVTVRNLSVTGFASGVQLYLSSNNTLENVTVSSNTDYGIQLYFSAQNTLTGNSADSNGIGIYLYFSALNTLTGNRTLGNADHGIVLYSSADNELSANDAPVASFVAQAAEPLAEPTAPPTLPERLEADGTHFEVTGSGVLNVIVDSTSPVKLILESAPEMVMMNVETVSTAASTTMTLRGLFPATTYHMYEDDFDNHTPFTTDSAGSYTWVQDLTRPHLLFIQPREATYFIRDDSTGGDCTTIGTWHWATKTCTLTTDVNETIQIGSNGITLDGRGHTVLAGGWWVGVYLYNKSGVTVRNLTVTGGYYGIVLNGSSGNTISGNRVSLGTSGGINLLFNSNGNTILGNTVGSSYYGIRLDYSSQNTLENNTFSENRSNGILLYNSSQNTISGNTTNSNNTGIRLSNNSSGNTVSGNTANSNNVNGIQLGWHSSGNTVSANTTNSNNIGIELDNNLIGNTISENTENSNYRGIVLSNSSQNTILGNTVSLSGIIGIDLYNSSQNTISGNTVSSSGLYGVRLFWSSYNETYKNNFIDNGVQAYVYDGSGNLFNLAPPTGGNYWSNYDTPGEDCNNVDGDNFCDSPYYFSGGQDNYPWTTQDGWLDGVPPVTTDDAPAGWQNADFTVTLTCTDNEGGSGCKETLHRVDGGDWYVGTSVEISTEGDHLVEYYSVDNLGNTEDTKSTRAMLDKTPPEITVTGVFDGAVYTLGDVPTASYTVSDSLSGMASDSATLTGGNANGVGSYTYNVTAADVASNTGTEIATYSVVYNFSGFLAPVNLGKPFKLGRTVPVKFQLTNASGNHISTAVATVGLQMMSGEEPVGDPIEVESTSAADTGNTFRYSETDNQYIYNLSTKGLSTGSWHLQLTLDDGTVKTALLSFK